jgi:hypothetical protein
MLTKTHCISTAMLQTPKQTDSAEKQQFYKSASEVYVFRATSVGEAPSGECMPWYVMSVANQWVIGEGCKYVQ